MSDLHVLAFCSKAAPCGNPDDLVAHVADVLATSRRNNAATNVTVALALQGDALFQVLEGPREILGTAFDRIRADPRHTSVELLHDRPAGIRRFAGQTMSLVGQSETSRGLLRSWSSTNNHDPEALIDTLAAMHRADAVPSQDGPAADADATPAGPRLDTARLRAELDEVRGAPGATPAIPVEMRALFDATAVALLDGGCILHANHRFAGLLGYDPGDLDGVPLARLKSERAGDAMRAAVGEKLAPGGDRGEVVQRFRARDGREIDVAARFCPLPGQDGRSARAILIARDVTAERRRQVEAEGQVAALHASSATICFDGHGVILDANPAFLEAMGYRLDEVQGHHHRILVDPSYAHSAEYADFWRSLVRGMHQSGQYRRLAKGGREVWLQASYNPVLDPDGQVLKIVGYASVVTAEKLRQAELQGQIAAIHKAQSVIAFDLDGTILDANTNFLDATGYRLAEVRGRHHRMFVDAETAESAEYKAFWRDLAAGKHQVAEYRRIGKDGRRVWLQATYNPIFDMNGRPFKVVKYATDVTDEKLRQSDYEGQIAAIWKSQGVIAFAMDGTILDANPVFLEALGYTLDEVKGRPHKMLVEPDHAASSDYAEFWAKLREGRFVTGLYKRIGKDGREVWIRASYNPILDLDGRPLKIIKFATDVTSDVRLAEAYEDAKRQAQHDSATALPNRTRLAAFMTSALATPDARLAVLYIDLDRFKPINDTFGHPVGDRVLGEVADRLRRSLGNDQIVARVGGDEFVVAAPGLSEEEIESFCQRLMDVVSVPIRHEGGEIKVSLSIGVAVSPADGVTPDELLRSADIALYRSKQNGRGLFSFFAAAMNDRIYGYRNLVEDMRRGLAQNEFYVDYQPRFAARTQTVQSVEALVRWHHPVHGRVSPADFIPLAERSGLIMALGTWVLREACRAAAGWPGIGVSVNVSPVQFRSGDLVEVVVQALADAGLDPHRLELEITEGVLLEDAARAQAALTRLKALGVKLAMDDFGTGYSSLSSLRSFPFDVIKIDRQFIADMETRECGRDIVRAILALGDALGLSVTAEGVETKRQLDMLAADDCAEVQGYLLARPMSPRDVSELLAEKPESTAPMPRVAAG